MAVGFDHVGWITLQGSRRAMGPTWEKEHHLEKAPKVPRKLFFKLSLNIFWWTFLVKTKSLHLPGFFFAEKNLLSNRTADRCADKHPW